MTTETTGKQALVALQKFLEKLPSVDSADMDKTLVTEDEHGALHVKNGQGVELVLLTKDEYEKLRGNGA